MKIFLNDILTELPNDYMTIEDIIDWKGIKASGTAVALNEKLVRKDQWPTIKLSPLDHLTIISGAFGG